jgi:pimeloyl-ACP methyl ester carboxylesterase
MTPIQFSHANGMPAPSYRVLLEALGERPIGYVERFGHGQFKVGYTWASLVDELIADIESRWKEPVIGIGHSLGGVLSMQAAARRPELFRQLILLDPPMFAPHRRWAMGTVRALGFGGKMIPPAVKAKRRKRTFASLEAARTYWLQRPFFQRFDPRCFEDYLHAGLEPAPEGVKLRFTAENEYRIFLGTPAFLPKAPRNLPVDFIIASFHDTLQPQDVAALRRRYPQAGFHVIEGTHMFPMEQPEAAAKAILNLITS